MKKSRLKISQWPSSSEEDAMSMNNWTGWPFTPGRSLLAYTIQTTVKTLPNNWLIMELVLSLKLLDLSFNVTLKGLHNLLLKPMMISCTYS